MQMTREKCKGGVVGHKNDNTQFNESILIGNNCRVYTRVPSCFFSLYCVFISLTLATAAAAAAAASVAALFYGFQQRHKLRESPAAAADAASIDC